MLNLDVGKESESYDLFVFAINAEQTSEKYITRIRKFFEIIGREEADDARKLQDIYREGKVRRWMACERNNQVPSVPKRQSKS